MHTGAGGTRRVGVLGGLGVYPAERLTGVGRRVLAHLAVKGPRVLRTLVCAELWPDLPEDRGRANLRRALWQMPAGMITVDGPDLVLEADVDLKEAFDIADRAAASEKLTADELRVLFKDLLPGWYEEWLLLEQDRFRLLRVQALEAACRTATRGHAYCVAASAGLAAVGAEPLRETAVIALVEAHLCEGNRYEALRRYSAYETLLRDELGATPGDALRSLVSDLVKS